MRTVLVTGGAGYIGTHIIVALAAKGYRCVSIDNYSNSSRHAIGRIERILSQSIPSHEGDIRDRERLRAIVHKEKIDAVIHLAGLKAVGESVSKPLLYYDNNVSGSLTLMKVLEDAGVREFVFSSSATVYGIGETMPLVESAAARPQSPYGRTKLAVEEVLVDQARADASWKVANLRYFNPVGAHESGLIGEHPSGVPNNLMPYVCQVAAGKREKLRVFGGDYPTRDGTGIRDYIHVMDVAEGHVSTLEALATSKPGTVVTANLGTGRGVSVLELVECFERVNSIPVPRQVVERRPGDVAVCYADPSFAKHALGWEATRNLEDMCADAWRWQKANPDGYRD